MRIALITTPTRSSEPIYFPPMGVARLAAYMERLGHEVVIFDAARVRWPREKLCEIVSAFQPDIIGISAIITAYGYTIHLSQALKQAMPFTPIVLGGHLTINNAANCFEHMAIDYLVHGYGEIVLEKLIEHISGSYPLENIRGLSYRCGSSFASNPGRDFVEDINTLPLPAYHLLDTEYYIANNSRDSYLRPYLERTGKTADNTRVGFMSLTLGCTGRCTFCVHEQEYIGINYFNTDYVENHIRYLYNTFSIRIFVVGEEMVFSSMKRVRDFCSLVREQFPDIYWSSATRAKYITPEMVSELEKSNCFAVNFGFESGSTRILTIMQKGVTAEENIHAAQCVGESTMTLAVTAMVGNIGETNETIAETEASIKQANLGQTVGLFYATPYPGGRIWDWTVEAGLIPDIHKYLLEISNRDASDFRVNLTPYPDWIVKLWFERLWRAVCYTAASQKPLPATRPSGLLAKWHTWVHETLYQLKLNAAETYCRLYDLAKQFAPICVSHKFDFDTDKRGVLLPKNLILGKQSKRSTLQ